VTALRQRHGEVHRHRRFADAALARGDREHARRAERATVAVPPEGAQPFAERIDLVGTHRLGHDVDRHGRTGGCCCLREAPAQLVDGRMLVGRDPHDDVDAVAPCPHLAERAGLAE